MAKDIRGTELQEGDTVAMTVPSYKDLVIGTVIQVTEQTVRVKPTTKKQWMAVDKDGAYRRVLNANCVIKIPPENENQKT